MEFQILWTTSCTQKRARSKRIERPVRCKNRDKNRLLSEHADEAGKDFICLFLHGARVCVWRVDINRLKRDCILVRQPSHILFALINPHFLSPHDARPLLHNQTTSEKKHLSGTRSTPGTRTKSP